MELSPLHRCALLLLLLAVRSASSTCTAPVKSRGQCQTCFAGAQCIEGYYCCPYMRLCVATSSMPCSNLVRACSPRCFDSSCDATGCEGCTGCELRAPYSTNPEYADLTWLEYANLDANRERTCNSYVDAAAKEEKEKVIIGVGVGVGAVVVVLAAVGVAVGGTIYYFAYRGVQKASEAAVLAQPVVGEC